MTASSGQVPEVERVPWGLRRVVRWSQRSLEPADYWGDRYLDVLHERVDGFLSGLLVGIIAMGLGFAFLLALVGAR